MQKQSTPQHTPHVAEAPVTPAVQDVDTDCDEEPKEATPARRRPAEEAEKKEEEEDSSGFGTVAQLGGIAAAAFFIGRFLRW
jgi:hypothetical protein